jgi:hypothetical protein
MERILLLAQMADKNPRAVIEQVWEIQKNRELSKKTMKSFEEVKPPAPDKLEAAQGHKTPL